MRVSSKEVILPELSDALSSIFGVFHNRRKGHASTESDKEQETIPSDVYDEMSRELLTYTERHNNNSGISIGDLVSWYKSVHTSTEEGTIRKVLGQMISTDLSLTVISNQGTESSSETSSETTEEDHKFDKAIVKVSLSSVSS